MDKLAEIPYLNSSYTVYKASTTFSSDPYPEFMVTEVGQVSFPFQKYFSKF